MDLNMRKQIYTDAKKWILAAGKMIRGKINDPLLVNSKSNANDLVTSLDKEVEQYFVKKVNEKYPQHLLLSEEGYGDDISSLSGVLWIIDPIDGTMNLVHLRRDFAISIGIYYEGIGEIGLIYNVMADELYHAKKSQGAYKNDIKLKQLRNDLKLESSMLALNHRWLCHNRFVDEIVMQNLVKKVRGTRTYGSAAIVFAYIAEGLIDGYLSMNLSPWDIAAGIILLEEVGGVTTTLTGERVNLLKDNPMITGNDLLHKEIINDYLLKGKK